MGIWLDQDKFTKYIQEIVGETKQIKKDVVRHVGYDVVIIGGGPAGLTAGIYCARARLKTVLLDGAGLGGQVMTTDNIENYPGFVGDSSGELIKNMEGQARRFGLEIQTFKRVNQIQLTVSDKEVRAGDEIYSAKAVILATGLKTAELGIPRETELRGQGVSYCAVCDANYFIGKKIAVVGGGDTAVEEALYLSKFASQVYLIHRRSELRAAKILQETAFQNQMITFLLNHVIQDLVGSNFLEGVKVQNLETGDTSRLEVDGLFIAIGSRPHTSFLKDIVALDEHGHVIVNDKMQTSVPGIYAAGDIRVTPLRQVSTAVGDGAIAAISAERYITENRKEE